jgi:acyl-CoA dehydrogenase
MATVESNPEPAGTAAGGLLFNPRTYDAAEFDPATRRVLLATIEFFESRGKRVLKEHDHERVWYSDFLGFCARERVFATLLTPAAEGGGDPDKRWDTARICAFNEITGFYGLVYWYTWQVSILGLGPIWQSQNAQAKQRAAKLLDEGSIFAFGLSEREHGADIYSTDMVLTPVDGGGFTASGGKYYIGNGNEAGMVSVFGRRADVEGPEGYVFFAADSRHPSYRLVRNVVNAQSYVSQFELEDYPVSEEDVLHTGKAAFHAALNTVNVGKFNLGFASVGICEHALYEAVTHASNRVLYGNSVTEFPHVRQYLTDAYARLVAMRLFGERATDYFRAAGQREEHSRIGDPASTASTQSLDRRYLLYNPIEKMKVTTEGERVINLLWDVIAAKGFEKDTYFEMAARDIRGLPKLEGTVHVNMALVLKFMANYFFNPAELEPVPPHREATDDEFLFNQGPTSGLGKIRFHDWRPVYEAFTDVPNVTRFVEQADALRTLLTTAPPDEAQQKDLGFLLIIGEMFTQVVYGQLILEQAQLAGVDRAVIDQIFDVFVRDFSAYAVTLHGQASTTEAQREWALNTVRNPVADAERFDRVWGDVAGLSGAYEMRP